MRYHTVNPADEQIIDQYETMSGSQVEAILRDTHIAFEDWSRRPLRQRSEAVLRLRDGLLDRRDYLARLMTREMGKPIAEARAEIEKSAWLCEVYAEKAAEWLAEDEVSAGGFLHRVVYQPLGVILSIMPWNFPFWQALRFGVPTLLAGNTSILKHASNVSGCGLAIEELFRDAGFPENVFRTILADHATVFDLISRDEICGVSLTGSTGAGVRIAEAAGRNLKKVVLELGGSDPFVVLDDADIEYTASQAVIGRNMNTGQSCIAAKRFIVMARVAEAFTQLFTALVAQLRIGDPMDEATQVGPLVNKAALLEIEDQVARSAAMGARIETGGYSLDRRGFFYQPTVMTGVTSRMPVFSEEVFGPVAPVIVVDSEAEALRLANDTEFGLGGSVWTRDLERGERFARRIQAGSVFVNSIVKSDPRMPFGGVKKSGLGRELARFGLLEFVNVKGLNIFPVP